MPSTNSRTVLPRRRSDRGHWSPTDTPTGCGTTHLASLCRQTHSRPEYTAPPFSRACPGPSLTLTDPEGHHTTSPRQSECPVLLLRRDLLSFPAFMTQYVTNLSLSVLSVCLPFLSMLVVFPLRHISIRQTVVCSHQRKLFSLNVRDPSI
jgi:hypothetical protein